MLPERESDNPAHLGSGCEYCKVTRSLTSIIVSESVSSQGLEDIAWRLQNLITCAQQSDSVTEDSNDSKQKRVCNDSTF